CLWLGQNEFFLRLPAVMFGLASLAMLMITMRAVLGTRAAPYAGAVYALNSKAIYHGQEARMYSMALFGAILSVYFFVRLLEKESWVCWIGYTTSTLVTCFTHVIYSLILAAEGGVVLYLHLVERPRQSVLRRLLGAQAALLLLLIPLAPIIRPIASSHAALGSFIPRPTLAALLHLLTWPELGLAVLFVLLSIPRFWATRQRLRETSLPEKALRGIGIACLGILPLGATLAGLGLVNILASRYLLLALLGAVIVPVALVVRANDGLLRLGLWTFVLFTALLEVAIAIQV